MATERQYGVTPAFSNSPPKPEEIKLNDTLVAELKAQNNFAPASDTERREALIKKFTVLLRQMVQMVGKKKGLPDGILETAGGKVFTYGSYRLGVYGPNSDVDTLMVAPKHVTREDFFEYMPDILRQSTAPGEITELVAVPGIGTPIIKLEIQGVDIDLIFCSLQLSAIPDDLELKDDNLLRGLDETDRRCVNGTRVTSRILELVPEPRTFRYALRAIKLWAQRRAIYGNIVGFPGGVAYAIMVARVCQLYPKAVASVLVQKFFFVMKRWNWPKPVFLQHKEESPLQLREWDPVNFRGDKAHLMPILTPAVPSTNTAHTVGPSTMAVMQREMTRGELISNDIISGKRPWKDLFERHDFFTQAYKHYIYVVTAGKSKDLQQAWAGLTQSKIKWLVKGIEDSDAASVELVQPFNKGFERVHECKNQEELTKTLEGGLDCQVKEIKTQTTDQSADPKQQVAAAAGNDGVEVPAMNGDVKEEVKWPQKVWTTTYYLGIGLKKAAQGLDISAPVKNFLNDCTQWPNYDENMHSIRIKHIRNFDLPADVFVDGEVRPTRPKKKVGKAESAANNKRSSSAAGLDVNTDSAKRRQSANGTSLTPRANGTATPNGVAG